MTKLRFLTDCSRRAEFFHLLFTQPRKYILVQPCTEFIRPFHKISKPATSFLHILLFMAAHSATACTREEGGPERTLKTTRRRRRGEERRGINAKEPRSLAARVSEPGPTSLARPLARYRCHLNQHIAQASRSPSPWHSFGTVGIGCGDTCGIWFVFYHPRVTTLDRSI